MRPAARQLRCLRLRAWPADVDPEAQDAALGAASLQHHDDHQLETLTRDMHTG